MRARWRRAAATFVALIIVSTSTSLDVEVKSILNEEVAIDRCPSGKQMQTPPEAGGFSNKGIALQ